jgi:DNA polymerase-4
MQVGLPRTILHADLDAFFASVEQLDDPSLRGRPVLVGGTSGRGVVAAASYESRAFGCRSAMPMVRALQLCPHAVVVKPRFGRYSELSGRFMEILGRCSPLVEPLSVDEAFVDVTGSRLLHGDGPTIAATVRDATRRELGLTVSVGVGPNKFVAKLASDMHKPDGLTVAPGDAAALADWLAPLAIERMWGIGPKTAPRFHAAGVRTFGDLQRMPAEEAVARLGDHAAAMRERALGRDEREVETEHERKGVGHETTFHEDVADPESVLDALHALAESACRRLRASGGTTRRITVKIRFGDFETITRSCTLESETDGTLAILGAAKALFRRWAEREFVPVRLVGIRLERTAPSDAPPASLFADPREERERAIDRVADAISGKFGAGAIARGGQRRAGGQQSAPQSSE